VADCRFWADYLKMRPYVERSIACLKGLSTGDAVGKQTETLKRDAVTRWYPSGIAGFHGEPGSVIPRYVARRYEWRVGETTDDTEQALAVADALIHEGALSHSSVGRRLMMCRKSNHVGVSLGRFQQRGDPDVICSDGDGCGAAMRVAPIGIVYSCGRLGDLVDAVFEASVPTHGGQLAICAAATVAAAVSAAVDGKPGEEVLSVGIEAAREAERLRPPSPAGNMAAALERMHAQLLAARGSLTARLQAEDCFPDRTAVIVPLAISLALVTQSASETILLATNLGGDADSVASIGGALAAAMFPQSVNDGWYEEVERVNNHKLVDVAAKLAALREANAARG
jgi:ADP-ribosylglycohydrolase